MPVRILLVDDHAGFRRAVTDFLSPAASFEIVGEAACGAEALEQAVRLAPDLVLMDIAMPGMDGLEATRRIKQMPNAPVVIVLTLYDGPPYRARAAACGADGFVAKSALDDQLAPLIARLFALIG